MDQQDDLIAPLRPVVLVEQRLDGVWAFRPRWDLTTWDHNHEAALVKFYHRPPVVKI
jgi:hypothetical protein